MTTMTSIEPIQLRADELLRYWEGSYKDASDEAYLQATYSVGEIEQFWNAVGQEIKRREGSQR